MLSRLVLSICLLACLAAAAHADEFDEYINPVLTKVPMAKGVKELQQLTPDVITDHDAVLPRVGSALLVVRTNEGRWAKLLVQAARQKVGEGQMIPILYIERFVTYREGEERTILASGQKMSLFPGFRFSLDLGQVVPEVLGGDLRFAVEGDKVYTEPLGKARLYLLTAPMPEATPKKGTKVVVGETFQANFFAGSYKLYDDGRRSGTLKLEVDKEGTVTGAYYSDRDGARYEVTGRVGSPAHTIQFSVRFPRSTQLFDGWMFTGDAKVITGKSRLIQHETGFYAVRMDP